MVLISAKGLRATVMKLEHSDMSIAQSCHEGHQSDAGTTEEELDQACNIIVYALGDHAVRLLVRSVIGKPLLMMSKL